MPKPIELTLYDPETNEAIKTYTRSFVPWAILKRAVNIQRSFDASGGVTDEEIDELASIVVAMFGDQFSLDDVSRGADVGEMMVVIQSIISRASQFMSAGNPTKAAS